MTTIHQSEIHKQFDLALTVAKQKNKAILFSHTEKLHYTSPHAIYASAVQLFRGKRFYWKDPKEETIVVGLGIVQSFETDLNEERFDYIEKQWNQFLKDAYIFNPFKEQGTGPLIMGGFSFDPLSQKDSEWSSFSNALFHLPIFMISQHNNELFITINMICEPEAKASSLNKLLSIKEELLSLNKKYQLQMAVLESKTEINSDQWKNAVGDVVELLKEEQLKKVVLARKMKLTFNESLFSESIIKHLNDVQHESYIFALEHEQSCFLGATPERLVQKIGNQVLSTCLAGSIKRGSNFEEDIAFGNQLLSDVKNRHEHQLVVTMIANVINKYCTNVDIPDAPVLMKMRDIQHLYTPVQGIMEEEDNTILQLVKALHPTPAMGGVPTFDALQVIREVENMDRGYYAAPIGWMDYRGNGEFAVAIRSGLLKENEAFLYAGCGVVSDSIPEDEYLETRIKFRPMLRALGGKEL